MHRYEAGVPSTWEASFRAIEKQDPAVARLLSLLAFVNFEDVFVSLFAVHVTATLARSLACIVEGPETNISLDKRGGRSFPIIKGSLYTTWESAFETLGVTH